MLEKIRAGSLFGKWTLVKEIGRGGNGQVWEANNTIGEMCAIKILSNQSNNENYQRFCREIDFLKSHKLPLGVVPLLDSSIPADLNSSRAWYVMPLAESYWKSSETMDAYAIASDFKLLAKTLKELHEQGIFHRDIKPANFLTLDGRVCISDFGLVKVPDVDGLTVARRDVGAKFTYCT